MSAFSPDIALLESERGILARVARGGPIKDVLRDLILLVEKPAGGDMLASILVVSEDGTRLLEGAAPNLPRSYNDAIDGIAIGPGVGSCGTAAYTGEPVFVSDIATDPLWADFRDIARENGLAACWSVPIKSGDGEVLGTFANYYREPRTPTERDMVTIATVAQTAAIAIERHRAEMARERAEEQRELTLRELNHRVKNIFALTNALISMTARNSKTVEELANTLRGRMSALRGAHELIVGGIDGHHAEADGVVLGELVRNALRPFAGETAEDVDLAGPKLQISSGSLNNLALIIHELATNAAKYGSLSTQQGMLSVRWTLASDRLRIVWRESDGPPVRKPDNLGFGSQLIRRLIEAQLDGTLEYDWNPSGLTITVDLPASMVSAS